MEDAARLDAFVSEAGSILASGKPDAFFAVQEPLGALAASGWAAWHVRRLLEDVGRSPQDGVPGAGEGGLTVARDSGWSLTLRAAPLEGLPGILVSAAAHCLIAPVGHEPARLEVYARPQHERPDALDGQPLAPLGVHTVLRGQVLALDAGERLADFAQPQIVCPHLLLTGPAVLAYRLAYDRTTLSAVQVISADLDASRLTYAIRLLGAAGQAGSGPRLEELSRHRQHQVRWEAIRALFRVDRPAATVRLHEAAVHDPHPEIRATAAAALGQLPAQTPAPGS